MKKGTPICRDFRQERTLQTDREPFRLEWLPMFFCWPVLHEPAVFPLPFPEFVGRQEFYFFKPASFVAPQGPWIVVVRV